VIESEQTFLLLCTNGALQTRIFQHHRLWHLAEKQIIIPKKEQHSIHKFIYQIKREGMNETAISFLDNLLKKYKTNSFIAGCTEIHLITKYLIRQNQQNYDVIDPLLTIAKDLKKFIESHLESSPYNTIRYKKSGINLFF
jgi:aspartate racemase